MRYFPKGFFPKKQLPKDIFPCSNFPNLQFSRRLIPKSVLAAALNPLPIQVPTLGTYCSQLRLRRPSLTFGKLHIKEVANWENVTWGDPFGKIPNIVPDRHFLQYSEREKGKLEKLPPGVYMEGIHPFTQMEKK